MVSVPRRGRLGARDAGKAWISFPEIHANAKVTLSYDIWPTTAVTFIPTLLESEETFSQITCGQ